MGVLRDVLDVLSLRGGLCLGGVCLFHDALVVAPSRFRDDAASALVPGRKDGNASAHSTVEDFRGRKSRKVDQRRPAARRRVSSSITSQQPGFNPRPKRIAILIGRWGNWPHGLAAVLLRTMAHNQLLDFHILSDVFPAVLSRRLPANVQLHHMTLGMVIKRMQRTIGLKLGSVSPGVWRGR